MDILRKLQAWADLRRRINLLKDERKLLKRLLKNRPDYVTPKWQAWRNERLAEVEREIVKLKNNRI
jgi:hypothetical protein